MAESFLSQSIAILERTPAALDAMLRGLPAIWTDGTEGPGTWSPYVVVGHLIHGEKTDWIPRLEIILKYGEGRAFDPFDREAQFRDSKGRSLEQLLDEFATMRKERVARLRSLDLQPSQLELTGTHPELGRVTVRQLLATWTAHDLGHVLQISRAMAKQYKEEVGPWEKYLSVMH